jgi:flagellar M-ring protein FliF
LEQFTKFFKNLNTSQRAVILGGFSVLFIFLLFLLAYSNFKNSQGKHSYTIASNITKSQVMLASSELEASNIPFSIIGTGNSLTLKTDKSHINVARIKLVTSQASTDRHVGWEIFEKSSLGTTNFENKIKYLRALEGELARSVESLSSVLNASIKVAIPKETLFTKNKKLPTASAIITLKPGMSLTQGQIEGIKNFIGSAVPSLLTKNIKLINQDGTLLEESSKQKQDKLIYQQDNYRKKLEESYEKKVINLLEPIIGKDRVIAKVSIELDFVKKVIQQEIYDPEGTIRSQQTEESASTSNSKEPAKTNGVPGVQSNIQNPNEESSSGAKQDSSLENTKNIINYEISKKIINQTNGAFANIKRLSCAVTFDLTDNKIKDQKKYILNLTQLTQEAVAYNFKRGDIVTVKGFEFYTASQEDGKEKSNSITSDSVDNLGLVKSILNDFAEILKYIIVSILLFVFYKKFIIGGSLQLSSLGVNTSNVASRANNSSNNNSQDVNDVSFSDFEDDLDSGQFDKSMANKALKNRIKAQLSNIDGMDEESAAKFEVLMENINEDVEKAPEEIGEMIQMLLSGEGGKFAK